MSRRWEWRFRGALVAVLSVAATMAFAAWAPGQALAQSNENAARAEAWLIAHARLAAGPSAAQSTMNLAETWTPENGRPSRVDRARVAFLDSVELEAPTSRQGRLLTPRQAAKVSRHLARLRARVRQAWRGPGDDGRLVIVDNRVVRLDALMRRFYWRPAGVGAYLGAPCRRFAFRPQPGVRAASRAEEVMGAMAGEVCVEPQTGMVLEVHYHNQESVRFGWGILGSFSGISGSFTLQRAGSSWTWGRTVVHLRGRELWFSKSGTLVKQYRLSASSPRAAGLKK